MSCEHFSQTRTRPQVRSAESVRRRAHPRLVRSTLCDDVGAIPEPDQTSSACAEPSRLRRCLRHMPGVRRRVAASSRLPQRRRSSSDECRPRSTRALGFTRLRGTGSLAARYRPARSCLCTPCALRTAWRCCWSSPAGMSSPLRWTAATTRDCGSVLGLSFGVLIGSRPDGDSQLRPRCA